ncbi:MAG: hypothetical protein K0U37_06025 [Gammaproteobacteria bacterium]|nr:hypothetical protein [Gammaproteobacteria bacterium]
MSDWGVFGILGVLALSVAVYPLRNKKRLILLLLPVSAVFLVLAYSGFGGWFEWHTFQVAQKKQAEAKQVIQALGSTTAIIERLKARLAETPKDAKAWFLLGRVYVSEGDWKHANEAYVIAHSLAPDNHEYSLHYAQSVWELNQQAFDDKTRALLEGILHVDSNQPDALAMLAYDAYTRHLNQDAVKYWERLLVLTPSPSEDADKLRQAIAKARQDEMVTG